MNLADATVFVGLLFIAAGASMACTGFYFKVRADRSTYLPISSLGQWKVLTPEEAARTWMPLNQPTR